MIDSTPELDEAWHPFFDVALIPRDVSVVINTHLHFDHCGGNRLFRGVPIYVQRAEYEAVAEPDYLVEWVHAPGLRYELVDGDVELLPGISTLFTPGHS